MGVNGYSKILLAAISLTYLCFLALSGSWGWSKCLILLAFNGVYWMSAASRGFIHLTLPVLVYGLVYDILGNYPNYLFQKVSIQELYNAEKVLFGIPWEGGRISLNELFAVFNHFIIDLVCGLVYLSWFPVPVIFMIYWWWKRDKQLANHFVWTFCGMSFLSLLIQYIYPAAPPWYIAESGFDFIPNTGGSPAGFMRVDELLGIPIFTNFYNANANVFAAFPSLHCANPTILLLFAIGPARTKRRWIFWVYLLLMWFAAVYSGHHYVIDVLGGGSVASFAFLTYRIFTSKSRASEKTIFRGV